MHTSHESPRTLLATADKKCTVYRRGGMGVVRTIVKYCTVESGSYAQYSSALFLTYREPRQRRDRQLTQTYKPSLLILAGTDTPEPDSMWGKPETRGGVTTTRSLYSSCDPRWQSDFDAMIDAKIAAGEVEVIFDGRKHDPHGRKHDPHGHK